ncbi:hypothetical protein BGX31_006788 [Mortierella sp. GBA43]|nr:hypothetical protein BGX31_006788 [Mortierella sp. GBA43]
MVSAYKAEKESSSKSSLLGQEGVVEKSKGYGQQDHSEEKQGKDEQLELELKNKDDPQAGGSSTADLQDSVLPEKDAENNQQGRDTESKGDVEKPKDPQNASTPPESGPADDQSVEKKEDAAQPAKQEDQSHQPKKQDNVSLGKAGKGEWDNDRECTFAPESICKARVQVSSRWSILQEIKTGPGIFK